jgi:hypothetical protein
MAAQGDIKDNFTFVGGLNTEGGFFVIPENSWKEGVNVVPSTDGSVVRRNGIDYEELYQLFNANITFDEKNLWAFSVNTWSTINGNGDLNFFVVQIGPTVHFYDAGSGTVSATKKSFSINLTDYIASGNTEIAGSGVISVASTYGKLIITSSNTDPLLVTYNNDTDNITHERITIKIRDFEGFPSPVSADTEYTQAEWEAINFYDQALYNIKNQGWPDVRITKYRSDNSGKLPANTKQWFLGKDPEGDYRSSVLNKIDFGNSPAPKGRFVIDAFNQDRSGIITATPFRPKVCAFFAGRSWYAGISSDKQLGTVYFSQVLDDISKVGLCHQSNDPTSEEISDLIDSDGGVIQIPEAGEITSLQPLGRGIAVFATNGVWFISGVDSGFTAASYAVDKVNSIGCFASKSIVQVEDSVVYWSNTGIYLLNAEGGINVQTQNVSNQTIKSFYNSIPAINKQYAEGSYNGTDNIVYWLFNNTTIDDTESRYAKNSVLAFDSRLQSWYWFSFDTSTGVIPVSLETSKETSRSTIIYNIVAGADNVVVEDDNVVSDISQRSGSSQQFKFMVLHPDNSSYKVTFADLLNERNADTKFKDWYSFNDGVEQEAYVITGYELGGVGPARNKTAQYCTVFMNRTETGFDNTGNAINESACLLEARWDFTDSSFANKWSAPIQVYRQPRPFLALANSDFEDGYPLVISKNKIRGRGKAVQFKFSSVEGKDMQIVGWSATFVGNTNV